MTLRRLAIMVIGECDVHATLLQQAIEQDKNIDITDKEPNIKRMLSRLPLQTVPDVMVLIQNDQPFFQKLIDSMYRHHPQLPLMVLGNKKEEEFRIVNKKVFAYLVPEQCKEYGNALRTVAIKQHYTTPQFWDKHDLVMSHEQSGKAIDMMSNLPEDLENLAKAIEEHPNYTYLELGKHILHLSDDRAYYKTKKLWQLLGFTGKKELTTFLLQYYSLNG